MSYTCNIILNNKLSDYRGLVPGNAEAGVDGAAAAQGAAGGAVAQGAAVGAADAHGAAGGASGADGG